MDDLLHYVSMSIPFLAGAAAWGGAKMARQDDRVLLAKLEDRQDEHEKQDTAIHTEMIDRMARVETKIDILLEKR